MFKNCYDLTLLQSDRQYEDLFSALFCSDYSFKPMSSGSQYPNDDDFKDIEDIINKNLSEIDQIIRSPQNPSDELHIHEIKEQLEQIEPRTPINSCGIVDQSEVLANVHTINDDQPIKANVNHLILSQTLIQTNSDSMASIPSVNPVSPMSDVCQTINSLNINNQSPVMNGHFSPPNIEVNTLSPPDPTANVFQRFRCYSDGPQLSDIMPQIGANFGNSLSYNSQPIAITGHRGGHSAQPYRGRQHSTDPLPLPRFDAAFRSSTQTTQNDFSMESADFSLGASAMSPSSQSEDFFFPEVVRPRWRSEPLLRAPDRVSHRGRPFSRPQTRRQPTQREKREQLDNDLQAHEVTNYELRTTVGSLYSLWQQIRRRLQDRGYTQSQLDDIHAQIVAQNSPRGGHS